MQAVRARRVGVLSGFGRLVAVFAEVVEFVEFVELVEFARVLDSLDPLIDLKFTL